jgi:thiamine-monophosphate kinase
MQLINAISENRFIAHLVKGFERSPHQLNVLHESDAELLHLPGQSAIIAITTDSICEEIDRGIYTDPYLIGHSVVTVNLSDLAAVGACPVGLILNETLTADLSGDFITKLQKGIEDACRMYKISILGGDTNFSSHFQLGATAIGYIQGGKPITRKGCNAGDHIYCSGRMGIGNAYASEKLVLNGDNVSSYFPVARIEEGIIVSQYASSCIDTSDGCIAALDQLMRINNRGFRITTSVSDYLESSAGLVCRRNDIPEWLMLAGPHGEFELLFTIPPANADIFIIHAETIGWKPIYLGLVVEVPEITLNVYNKLQRFDTAHIRNLFYNNDFSIQYYLSELMKLEHTNNEGDL